MVSWLWSVMQGRVQSASCVSMDTVNISQMTLTVFVGVVALRYQHHTTHEKTTLLKVSLTVLRFIYLHVSWLIIQPEAA